MTVTHLWFVIGSILTVLYVLWFIHELISAKDEEELGFKQKTTETNTEGKNEILDV